MTSSVGILWEKDGWSYGNLPVFGGKSILVPDPLAPRAAHGNHDRQHIQRGMPSPMDLVVPPWIGTPCIVDFPIKSDDFP